MIKVDEGIETDFSFPEGKCISPHQMVTEVLDGRNAGEIFYSNIKNAVNSGITKEVNIPELADPLKSLN